MRRVLLLAPVLAMASATQAIEPAEREVVFVECLAEKQPGLIAKIRDADSEEAFLAALKEGAQVCSVEIDGMSMGKLFRELAKHKADAAGDGE